jgi:hypothetical protein
MQLIIFIIMIINIYARKKENKTKLKHFNSINKVWRPNFKPKKYFSDFNSLSTLNEN